MTTITQTITTLPIAPDPSTMTRAVFATTAAASVLAQKAMVPELNTWAGQVNTVAGEVNTAANAAAASASSANTSKANAATSEANAAGYAASALSAPGTSASSTTSMTPGIGSQSFTLAQTGKAFVIGQWVTISDSVAPATNYAIGPITAFNAGTGAITVNRVAGVGVIGTSWVIAAASPPGAAGNLPVTTVAGTTQTAVAGNHYLMTNAATSVLTLPPNPSANDEVWVTFTNGLYTNSVARNTKTIYGDSLDFTVNAGVLLTWKFKYLNTDWKTV